MSATPELLEALREAMTLMPLGTAKRARWLGKAAAAIAMVEPNPKAKPRWKCPCCGSTNVQISLPTWYHETVTGKDQAGADLEFVETDWDADISWWYCENCDETDSGQPEEIEYDV